VSNGFVDPNGNPITLTFNMSSDLNGTLYFPIGSISAPSPTGAQYVYAPQNGVLETAGNQTVNFSVSSSYSGVTTSGAALSAIYPSFVSISDPNLNVNNTHHGGMVFDTSGGVDYTTPNNYGGISYYNGSGTGVTSAYSAQPTAPILGSIVTVTGAPFVAITGNQAQTFGNPPTSLFPVPNPTAAPVPNGSAVAFDNSGDIWYTSGSNVVDYPLVSGSPNTFSIHVNTAAGLALDSSNNVWIVDTVDDQLIEYPGLNTHFLQPGGQPWDVLISNNDIYVTDHGPNPAIVQLNGSGSIVNTISVPGGAIPWYLMPDNAQPGIVWFDYLQNGQIGIGRMDTNTSPTTFVMATDVNGPSGSQAGAIGAASNGLVYMVFDGTSTLVQVSR